MAIVQCERCSKVFELKNSMQRKWYVGKRYSDISGLVNTCLLCDDCYKLLVDFMEDVETELSAKDVEECECSFFDTLLAMLDDATIAQLDEIAKIEEEKEKEE